MPATVREILGPEGAIARRMGDRHEFRPQQLAMADAVESALADGRHLFVEAGTGVGKSFAYLLPAIDYAVRNRKRVVISTHTISLQEQLVEKDIPLLQAVYPDEFTAVLVKGRGNYLCMRRLERSGRRRNHLFGDPRQIESLEKIEQWARQTRDGSLADLPSLPDERVWDGVRAEQGNCLGRKCRFYEPCFWQAARRRMNGGTILIVNHALFFSDLALRMAGVSYLPKYDAVILDEAHTIEDVAGRHFGIEVTEGGIRHQLRTLHDPRRGRGVLDAFGAAADDAIADVKVLHGLADRFFEECLRRHRARRGGSGRIREPNFVPNPLSPKLRELSLHLKAMLTELTDDEDVTEISATAQKISDTARTLDALISQSLADTVYWMDVSGQGGRRVALHAAPVNVSRGLRAELFDHVRCAVMTSATLCTGRAAESSEDSAQGIDPFAYVKSRLGAEDARTLALGSPFDYAEQATLFVESDLPEPTDTLRFLPAACDRILEYLKRTSGGAFVLFTSYRMLADAAERLRPALERLGFPPLVQGEDVPRRVLLEQFRTLDNAVLFGTSSFWQGIDVRGDRLRNVIIVKLPFAAPDEPVIEARLEAIRREGGDPFRQYSVPEAILRLKQGFGRLIRSRTDTGIVVILDSRVKSKWYGRLFLGALPPCRIGMADERE